jgi:asparagine synthase (glutamine-hydrolysing)
MCGIAGCVDLDRATSPQELEHVVAQMAATLRHRGPDDKGAWVDARHGVGLAHRRLAVIDVSPAGAQPMSMADDAAVISYNGELYNFREIRKSLESEGHCFRGNSDTEVFLAAAERWGIDGALQRSNGMFALALWDRRAGVLHLARDRMGEKPLYYGWLGRTFVFGSELKALRAHPAWRQDLDRQALGEYFRLGYVPAPLSIYQGIRKLLPGTRVSLELHAGALGAPEPYWSLNDLACQPRRASGRIADAVDELDEVLDRAVRSRMVADVPVGAFLSGGVDSSAVVALMQKSTSNPVKTFTIGFDDPAYDESANAEAVAHHLGTDHTAMRVAPADCLAVIPELPAMYDEPFADWSQIPTHLVSKLARSQVTVALSGDGGDELFGGYNRYTWTLALWPRMHRMPKALRSGAGKVLAALPHAVLDPAMARLSRYLPEGLRVRTPGTKLRKLAEVLPADGPEDMFLMLTHQWQHPGQLVRGFNGFSPTRFVRPACPLPEAERMMFHDSITYLPDDILVKVDRASMAVSLEARVPLLDHRVVEFAWQLPLDLRIRFGSGKWLLRQVLDRYVPPQLTDRPKAGFGMPMAAWLRGPLRDWAEDLLSRERLVHDGYLEPDPVTKAWSVHQRGRQDNEHLLWSVIAFQAWLDHWESR